MFCLAFGPFDNFDYKDCLKLGLGLGSQIGFWNSLFLKWGCQSDTSQLIDHLLLWKWPQATYGSLSQHLSPEWSTAAILCSSFSLGPFRKKENKNFSFKKDFTESSITNEDIKWAYEKNQLYLQLRRLRGDETKGPKLAPHTPFFSSHFLIQRNTGENVKPQACSSSKIHRIKDHSGRPFPRWLSGVVLGLLIHGMILYVYGAKGKQWRTEGNSHWSVRTDC